MTRLWLVVGRNAVDSIFKSLIQIFSWRVNNVWITLTIHEVFLVAWLDWSHLYSKYLFTDDLAGVKVLHGLDKVMEGGAVVLTLKDQNILADGGVNEGRVAWNYFGFVRALLLIGMDYFIINFF